MLIRSSCFQKDIFNIVYLSESLHLYDIADYWRAIISMNEHQKDRFTKRIISCLYNNLAGKKLAVLGFAFKKDTSDTRESPAITLVSNFVAERARVAIYDPRVPEHRIWHELADNGCNSDMLKRNVSVYQSAYSACEGADAVIIATEWDEFSNKPTMTTPMMKERLSQPTTHDYSGCSPTHASPKITKQELLSVPQFRQETATSFHVPPRRSTGVVIKDPKNGEIKTFAVQPSFSGISSLQSPVVKSTNFESPPRQSHGLMLRDPNITPDKTVSFGQAISGNLPFSKANLALNRSVTAEPMSQTAASSVDLSVRGVEIATKPLQTSRLDWARIASKMRKPMFVFDGRNILNHSELEALGFRVEAIGKRGSMVRD